MDEKKEVPEECLTSDFGCPNCLWEGLECKRGSIYKPKVDEKRSSPCDNYVYYD